MRTACRILAAATLVAACSDDARVATGDSPAAVPVDSSEPGRSARVPTGWDERAGPALLIAGEQAEEVLVVLPDVQGDAAADTLDASAYAGSRATLVSRAGVAGVVALAPPPAPDPEGAACTAWPTLAAPGAPSWTAGFVGRDVSALALDSLHGLPSRDSTRLVSEVARLASVTPSVRSGDTAESFRGLPFDVRDARTFTHEGLEVLVAQVVRRVNQEANPLEEHILMVAERRRGATEWTTTYSERAVGHEESVARQELLAAVLLGGEPTLVLAHESGEGVTYSLVRRGTDGWRTAWRSGRTHC